MIKKEIKLTKNQIEPFRELVYLKGGIAEMMILVGKRQEELWERLKKELSIRGGESMKINHIKKILTYFVQEDKKER